MKKYLFGALIGLGAFTLVGGVVALANTGNGFGMFGDGSGHEQILEAKADILGIPDDELETKLEDTSFPELLDEQGVTHTEFREQMQANMTERLQQMVDEGTITEEQMLEKLDLMEQHHAEGGGPHMMGKGMHGSMADKNGDGVCDHLDQK